MRGAGPAQDSLVPPSGAGAGAGPGGRRSSWLDSIQWALSGSGGARRGSVAQSSHSGSSEQSSSGHESSSAASAFSRLSVSTLLGLSAPAARTSAEKPKGEKARTLLKILLKSQRSPESSGSELVTDIHSLVPCGDVVGLLAVSVKQLKDFTTKFNVKRDTSLLVRISIDRIMKCTNPQVYRANQKNSRKSTTVTFGDVRYFSVKVPNHKSDARNKIVLELVGFEGPKDFPRLFGTVTMHLYEVIQKQSFIETCAVRIRNMVFCTMDVEYMFCYGSLGYGYSHQLKLPGADPAKAVAYSMFMRVPPPKDRKDSTNNVIKPQLMDYPAFLSPDLNVRMGSFELEPPEETEEYRRLQRALQEPPRERLVKMKQEYRSLKTWREKAEYLDQLILKRGPKTKTGLMKVSRFRQFVEKVRPLSKDSSTSQAETVIREEKLSESLASFRDSLYEMARTKSELPLAELSAATDSEADLGKEDNLPASAETPASVPAPAVTSGTSVSHLESMESTEGGLHQRSETSLSGSSEIAAECSETGDSESPAAESPEAKAADEEPAPPVKKEAALEDLQSVKESRSWSQGTVKFTEEVEAPKASESGAEIVPQWPWKEVEFQEAVFTGNKFEPFLRHIKGVQPPEPPKGKAEETSISKNLEKMPPHVETKEQEDQDPPHQMSPTKATSSSDTKLVKDGRQLSILRLIEKGIELEEEKPQMAKEPKPPEKTLSESEVKQAHDSFKRSVEDFLVNRLTKVIALKSLLSKHVENLVEDRLLEAEISEELEDSMDTVESVPDAKGKHLLVGRTPCSTERLSEQDISDLKAAASQNLQANLMGKLCAYGIIPVVELAEHNQKISDSSAAEEGLVKRKKPLSKENISQPQIKTVKALSDGQSGESSEAESMSSSQETPLAIKILAGINTEAGLDKECPPKSLEIIRVRLPVSTETESSKKSLDEPNKTANDALIEKLLRTEVAGLKSFLSKGLQDHLKDKLLKTGLNTKEDFQKVFQKLASTTEGEFMVAPEKAFPETKRKSAFGESIQNFVLDALSESEVANLKSVLDKTIQDHLLERLSEIGLITEEELRKVLENFFPVVTEASLPTGNNEKASFKKGEDAHSTCSLTQSLHDRFSEEELKNLKSLLNRLLKEDHRDKLSESEIKGLTSVLQKNFKDLPIQSSSETGISKEVEIKDECQSIPLPNVEESSPADTTVNVSEKERKKSKDSLSKIFLGEKPGLGKTPDLPVNSVPEADKETQTNGCLSPPKKVTLKGEMPESSVLGVETPQRETQSRASARPPKKVKQSPKKESYSLQSSDPPEAPNSSRGFETVLKSQPFDERLARRSDPFVSPSLTRVSEPFASSSFLSAHDIGVQTELKNYLSRPPGYLSKPTFPVNPQTFLFLHSESEEEAKLASRLHPRSKSRKKPEKSSRKDTGPHHPHPGVLHPQAKKEKPPSGVTPKEAVKERGRKHFEPPSPRHSLTDNRKESKATASPSAGRMESFKSKAEKKRQEVKPKKSFSKLSAPSDPQLQNLEENLLDKSSLTKFPPSWHTAGNTPNIQGTLDLDMDTFKHLEKAIERALIDLGKAPEGSSSQAPYSARPNAAPGVAAAARELLRSLATNPSALENPRRSASSLSEALDKQEPALKMSPEQLEVVLRILQNVLMRYIC